MVTGPVGEAQATNDTYARTAQQDNWNDQDGSLASPVVAALEQVWQGIRARHPELPAVVVVLAAGSVGTPRGMLKLGHFAAMRWDHAGDALPEVFVGGEGLVRGGIDVLGTLLHEATHALAHVRGIKDTSRQGRYHNRRFAAWPASSASTSARCP